MNDTLGLAELRRLTDRVEIIELFDRFAGAADARDWEAFRRIFTPDVVLDHTTAGEDDPSMATVWVGYDEVLANVSDGTERHLVTQHLITNHRISLDGDRASVVATMLSLHADSRSSGQIVQIQQGWYLSTLVRSPEGWRMKRLKPSVWKALILPIAEPVGEPTAEARRREVRDFLAI